MTSMPQGSAGVACRARAATRRSSLELAVNPATVRIARHWSAKLLAEPELSRDQGLIDTAVLLVSELVTNAIEAVRQLPACSLSAGPLPAGQSRPPAPFIAPTSPIARPRVWLAIAGSADMVRLEVHDSACALVPAMCHRDDDEESGRGLEVVAALASSWGWAPEPLGKVVWCELLVSGS
jgi:hypothetical protein